MAQVNIGAIKFNWKGPYNNGTAYVVDDVVSSGGSSYVCILASTGNAVSNGTYWQIMSSAGSNGTDADLLNISNTAQGDLYYNSGSAIARVPKGTAGQVLKMNSGATAPEYGTISTGAYSIAQISRSGLGNTSHSGSSNTAYNFGTPIQVTPTASTDLIEIKLQTAIEAQGDMYVGLAFGVNTSDSWGTTTNDSRLKQSTGEFAYGMGDGHDSGRYQVLHLIGIYSPSDLGMSAGTNYYVSPHLLIHGQSGGVGTGYRTTNYQGDPNRFDLIRYTV
jgi:hypothetical protein